MGPVVFELLDPTFLHDELLGRKRSFLHTELSIAGNEAIGHRTAAIISDRPWARTGKAGAIRS